MIIEVDNAVNRFHKDCKSLGEKMMKDLNNVPMTVAVLIEDKEHNFITAIAPEIGFLYDTENKQVFIDAITHMISTTKPIAIGIISEAWMVKRKQEEAYNFDIPVREQVDRAEVMMVQIETYKDNSLTIYEIIRQGDTVRLELDEEHSKISKENVGGAFSELLKVNYDTFSKSIVDNIKHNLN
jgi:hypothetical protein